MAAKKFLRLVTGRVAEIFGTQTSAGVANAGDIPALADDGRLDPSLMPTGFGPNATTITASEALSASNLVNVWDDSGTPKVRKADATTIGKEADGFVISAVSSGNPALVYNEGVISGFVGLTIGARYYLDTTAGGITATPPSGDGNVVQYVGRAISTTEIIFEPHDAITVEA